MQVDPKRGILVFYEGPHAEEARNWDDPEGGPSRDFVVDGYRAYYSAPPRPPTPREAAEAKEREQEWERRQAEATGRHLLPTPAHRLHDYMPAANLARF